MSTLEIIELIILIIYAIIVYLSIPIKNSNSKKYCQFKPPMLPPVPERNSETENIIRYKEVK
jgi:hypothetical protein